AGLECLGGACNDVNKKRDERQVSFHAAFFSMTNLNKQWFSQDVCSRFILRLLGKKPYFCPNFIFIKFASYAT
ncbi:MAG TPA: hypothetical protein VI112_07730, partial [Bacteroidia bacterium]